MDNSKYLNQMVDVIIDRPLGSRHPKHEFIYLLNYGYVPDTISGDGEELDCYVLGEYEPLETFHGKCIAIIHRLNDDDDKLVIVQKEKRFSNEEIRALTDFQERFFESVIVRPSDYLRFNKNIPELSVTNIENSLNFYKCAGFKIEYERPENKFAFLSLDDEIQIMLQELKNTNNLDTDENDEKWDVGPLSYPFGNGINFQLEVKNVNEIYEKMKNAGYKIAYEIEENWYRQDDKMLGNREFLIQDPDGYLLRFAEDIEE